MKLCDPSLTRANLSALKMSIAHTTKRSTKIVLFSYFLYLLTYNINPQTIVSVISVLIFWLYIKSSTKVSRPVLKVMPTYI